MFFQRCCETSPGGTSPSEKLKRKARCSTMEVFGAASVSNHESSNKRLHQVTDNASGMTAMDFLGVDYLQPVLPEPWLHDATARTSSRLRQVQWARIECWEKSHDQLHPGEFWRGERQGSKNRQVPQRESREWSSRAHERGMWRAMLERCRWQETDWETLYHAFESN